MCSTFLSVFLKSAAALHRCFFETHSLREKYPNTKFFLVRIFLYSVGISKIRTRKYSALGFFLRSDSLTYFIQVRCYYHSKMQQKNTTHVCFLVLLVKIRNKLIKKHKQQVNSPEPHLMHLKNIF